MNAPQFNSRFRLNENEFRFVPEKSEMENGSSILNGQRQNSQFNSIRYDWAWEKYLDACVNQWMPQEVDMQGDLDLWNQYKISGESKKIFKQLLELLSKSRALQTENIVLQLYRHVTSYECRQFLLREAYEDALHVHGIQYTCESLRVFPNRYSHSGSEDMFYKVYKEKLGERIHDKLAMPSGLAPGGNDPGNMLELLGQYYLIYKGIVSQGCYALLLYLSRVLKMEGCQEIAENILSSINGHIDFGAAVMEQIKMEFPESHCESAQRLIKEEIKKAVELEINCLKKLMGDSLKGIPFSHLENYMYYVGNIRLAQAGILPEEELENPIPWMDAYLLPMEQIKEPSLN